MTLSVSSCAMPLPPALPKLAAPSPLADIDGPAYTDLAIWEIDPRARHGTDAEHFHPLLEAAAMDLLSTR